MEHLTMLDQFGGKEDGAILALTNEFFMYLKNAYGFQHDS
jgi:hypothetical protein